MRPDRHRPQAEAQTLGEIRYGVPDEAQRSALIATFIERTFVGSDGAVRHQAKNRDVIAAAKRALQRALEAHATIVEATTSPSMLHPARTDAIEKA